MTKQEIVDRIRVLEEELAIMRELLVDWPDGDATLHALDGEDLEDTLPGTGEARRRSSQRMQAVKPEDKKGG